MPLVLARLAVLASLLGLLGWSQLPVDSQERLAEALRLAATGRFAEAESELLTLEKLHPSNTEVQYRLGLVLLRQDKVDAASQRLERATTSMPNSPLAWLAVAETRLRLGKRQQAMQAAERAASQAGESPMIWRALAMFYSQAREYTTAAEYELRWSDSSPQDAASRFRAIELRLLAGQADSAIELATKTPGFQTSGVLHSMLARAYRIKNDPARAADALQSAIRLEPGDPAHYTDLAQLFLDHRTLEPALVVLEAAVPRFSADKNLLMLLGLTQYGRGRMEQALDAFLRVIDLDPDFEQAYGSLETLIPESGGRLPEIETRLIRLTERQPSNPLGYFLLAVVSATRADEVEAERFLRRCLAVGPKFWPAYFELHKLLKAQEKWTEAARVLEKATQLNPEFAPAHYALAQVYSTLGDKVGAERERLLHHRLVISQRQAQEKRGRELPKLPYRILQPQERE